MTLRLRDAATGVYVREFMLETLGREIVRACRHERSLCVCIIRIDGFDRLLSESGRKIAGELNSHVASRIQLALRQSDSLLSEWKDGELVLCLLECDLNGARSVLDRIKARIASEPAHVSSGPMTATISAGVAVYRPDSNAEILLQEAQFALDRASQKGINQIEHVVF